MEAEAASTPAEALAPERVPMDVGELATPGPLEALGGLYALDRIERDHREVRTVTRLCREGRLMAEDLVEAFAISDQLLGAPIALG